MSPTAICKLSLYWTYICNHIPIFSWRYFDSIRICFKSDLNHLSHFKTCISWQICHNIFFLCFWCIIIFIIIVIIILVLIVILMWWDLRGLSDLCRTLFSLCQECQGSCRSVVRRMGAQGHGSLHTEGHGHRAEGWKRGMKNKVEMGGKGRVG
jgi:hypothetical protein